MTTPGEYIKFTSQPPHPEHVEFTEPPRLLPLDGTEELHEDFGHKVGLELIDGLTPAETRTADSVEVATAALVLINMDVSGQLKPLSFMSGVLRAMEDRTAWTTGKGPQSLLVH